MLGARLLSNLSDAPYTGEFALLFNLTRRPLVSPTIPAQGALPAIVYVALGIYAAVGLGMVLSAVHSLQHWSKNKRSLAAQIHPLQLVLWGVLVAGGGLSFAFSYLFWGVTLFALALFWPRYVAK